MDEVEKRNPLLKVTVDGIVYPFDLDALNGRQMGQIEKWCSLTAIEFGEGIQNGTIGAATAAVFVSVDQAKGPLSSDEAVAAMDVVSVHSVIEFAYAEPAPVKKAAAKKAPAKSVAARKSAPAKKAAARSTAAKARTSR